MAIKTKLELLEEMRNEAKKEAMFKDFEIELINGKILTLVKEGDEPKRKSYLTNLTIAKAQFEGHEKMVAKIDREIEAERKK